MGSEVHRVTDAFMAVSSALDRLHGLLLHPAIDFTPVILTQPPSARDARRLSIEQSLSVLDAQWTDMEALRQKLSQTRKQLKRRQAMCRSALSPISAMPSELLRQVFAYLIPYTPTWADEDTRHALVNVCSEWRTVAYSQKALWSSLKLDGPPGTEDVRWLMSHPEPLRLAIGEDYVGAPSQFDVSEMPTLCPRLEALYCDGLDGPGALLYFAPPTGILPFTSLQTLSITMPHACSTCTRGINHESGGPFVLDSTVFPNLRTLLLKNVDLIADTFSGPNLQTLRLVTIELNTAHLRCILQNVPQLEVLHLSNIKWYPGPQIDDPPVGEEARLPTLPYLRELIVDRVERDYAMHLLTYVPCPQLQSLVIRGGYFWGEPTELQEDWPPRELNERGERDWFAWYVAIRCMLSQARDLRSLDLRLPAQTMYNVLRSLRPVPSEASEMEPSTLLPCLTSLRCDLHVHQDPQFRVALKQGETLLHTIKSRSGECAPLAKLHVNACAILKKNHSVLVALVSHPDVYECTYCAGVRPI